MRQFFLLVLCSWAGMQSSSVEAKFPTNFDQPLEEVAFGSCNRDELPQPLWSVISTEEPDLWIWLGDNVYADWHQPVGGQRYRGKVDVPWMRERYQSQFEREDYREFREEFAVLGTWDDHDYGKNNAGREFPLKKQARDLALDFFEVPSDDPRRSREGLYGAYDFGPEGRRTRVILLDVRYFASGPAAEEPTLLGDDQNQWFETQIRDDSVQLFLIAGGIQFLSAEHRYEKWNNYPEDREWLLNEIAESGAFAVLLSGDRHIHEISVIEDFAGGYPLMDVTSSGLTHSWDRFPGEKNSLRRGPVHNGLGFGLLQIDWSGHRPEVTASIIDREGEVHASYSVSERE